MFQFFIISQLFFAANLVASVSSDSTHSFCSFDLSKQSIVLLCTQNHTPFAQQSKKSLQPATCEKQNVLKPSHVPGQPGQEYLIDAINTGNFKQFKSCIERGDDLTSKNSQGYSPEGYLNRLANRNFNPQQAQHQKMKELIREHRVFAPGDFSSLFDR